MGNSSRKGRVKVIAVHDAAPSRHTSQGTRHLYHGANVTETVMIGTNVAGESPVSRYVPELPAYAWRGLSNPAARKIQAKLAELGID